MISKKRPFEVLWVGGGVSNIYIFFSSPNNHGHRKCSTVRKRDLQMTQIYYSSAVKRDGCDGVCEAH